MSVASLAERHGSTVTVKRATRTRDGADASSSAAWATVATGVKLFIQPLTDRIRQKGFGREVEAESVGFGLSTLNLQKDDGVIITALPVMGGGPPIGARFRVAATLPRHPGPAHLEVALQSTTETFA